MYTLYKFHFLNGISEINQLFDDILIIWPAPVYILGMHDIYRTDKLSTDMGENDVIFIAPINKWNPITRSDKVACW